MRQSGNVSGKPRAGDGSPLDSLPEEPESLGKCSCVNHQCTVTHHVQVNIYTTWGSRQNSKLWADVGQGVVTAGGQRAKRGSKTEETEHIRRLRTEGQ